MLVGVVVTAGLSWTLFEPSPKKTIKSNQNPAQMAATDAPEAALVASGRRELGIIGQLFEKRRKPDASAIERARQVVAPVAARCLADMEPSMPMAARLAVEVAIDVRNGESTIRAARLTPEDTNNHSPVGFAPQYNYLDDCVGLNLAGIVYPDPTLDRGEYMLRLAGLFGPATTE